MIRSTKPILFVETELVELTYPTKAGKALIDYAWAIAEAARTGVRPITPHIRAVVKPTDGPPRRATLRPGGTVTMIHTAGGIMVTTSLHERRVSNDQGWGRVEVTAEWVDHPEAPHDTGD